MEKKNDENKAQIGIIGNVYGKKKLYHEVKVSQLDKWILNTQNRIGSIHIQKDLKLVVISYAK